MFDVITFGGITRDIIFTTKGGKIVETPENIMEQSLLCFEFGAKIQANEVHFSLGGGACNVAAGLKQMGLKAALLGRIGSDKEGDLIVGQLRKEKINISLLQKDKKERTGSSIVILREGAGERTLFTYRGANENLEFKNPKTPVKWLYSTSISGKWQSVVKDIENFLKKSETKFMFNPGILQISAGRKKLGSIFLYTNILVVNRDEATELIYSDGYRNVEDPKEMIEIISSWGPENVVVTDGCRGAYAGNETEVFYAEVFKDTKRVDATGAGDGFGSGFLAGYIFSGDVKESLKFGMANSQSVISFYGAHNKLLNKEEAEKMSKKVKVKKI